MLDPTATPKCLAALPAVACWLTACSGFAPTAAAPKEPIAQTTVQPEARPQPTPDPAADRRIASLELQVLEKSAQVDQLQDQLDEARREVVRSMARQQSVATRAEAASGIAEAELALQSMPDNLAAGAAVRKLTEQSSAEFEKANYGGALYLANQAKSSALAARGQVAESDQSSLRPYERSLALPLQLETTTGANVRAGPGTGFGVVYTLPARSRVVAYSSAEQWLRVVDDSGRRGWISQSLIRGRP
ncbi:MAG TPA: SH3 domain-containing protein [Gammaproteobacteria bacterium]